MLKNKGFKSNLKASLQDPNLQLLLIILFVGFLLRFWGIWNIERTDEFNEVFEALKVDSGRLNLDRWNKKVLIYILAVEYGIYFCIGWLMGIFSNVSEFASKIVTDISPLFLIGRTTSALFGTIVIFVAYKIGTLLFDERVGLLASLFMCFNFVHVEHSHLVLVDITMSLAVVCTFFFAIKVAYGGQRKHYFFAGFFTGLAIVAKIPSVFILFSLLTGHLLFCYKEGGSITQPGSHRHIPILLAGICFGVILGNPGILIAPGQYFKYLVSLIGAYQGTSDKIPYFTSTNGYLFYLKSMASNMGLPVLLCSLSSILFSKKHWKEILLLVSFLLPFYLFISNSKWFVADRYLIPIYPFLSVLASAFVIHMLLRISRESLAIIVGIALIIVPASRIILFELSLTKQNTRYWAKEWIEKNIPKGSKILIDSGRTINTYSPPLIPNAENLAKMIRKIGNLEEGATFDESRIADAKSSIYFKYLLASLPETTYDLTSTERGEAVRKYEYYVENGFDYIITSDNITWRTKVPPWRQQFPEQAMTYDHVETMEPIKVFAPDRYRSGPVIKIYAVSR
ncbi:MAG: ArnT family glycosyltransferase [Candidatus Hodarchaeota archaeon]